VAEMVKKYYGTAIASTVYTVSVDKKNDKAFVRLVAHGKPYRLAIELSALRELASEEK